MVELKNTHRKQGLQAAVPGQRRVSAHRWRRAWSAGLTAYCLAPGPALSVGLVVFLPARSVLAQLGTGVLTGTVSDAATQQPLADVVVTASSPALQIEQIAVTDSSGSFRIPNLPPGQYALRYELDGYHPYGRTEIALGATVTLRVNAPLLPETLVGEEVRVVAASPVVDVGSTRSGLTITREFAERVPLAPPTGKGGAVRSFEQLADAAPTARNDLYGASIAGTTSVENQYLIDGLSVGDPGFGYNGTPLGVDFIKEATIVTGGYLPEYGRGGGGVLDVVTKSGSNEFRGSVFSYYSPWQGKPKYPATPDAITTTDRLNGVEDIGFELGGPVVKDALWFYVGADLSKSSYSLDRTLNSLRVGPDGLYVRDADDVIQIDPIPGAGSRYLASQTQFQYLLKLTYSPGSNDRLELTHRGTPSRGGGDGNYSIDYETGVPMVWANPGADIIGSYGSTAWRQIFDAYDTALKWTHSSDDKKLTLDTLIGWHHERTADLPVDGSALGSATGLAGTPMFVYQRTSPAPHSITEFENLPDPSVCDNPVEDGDARCPAAQYVVGGPQIIQDRNYDRYQLREVATYVTRWLGPHIIKGGVELEVLRYASSRAYPGGVALNENATGTAVNDFRRFGGLTGPDEAYTLADIRYQTSSFSVGAFAQDSWAIQDLVTLNGGLRYDAQYLYTDQGLGLALPNQWSPRLGVIYDPTQQGHAKLFANYAVYYQTIPLNVVDRAGSGEPYIRSRRAIADCDPTSPTYPGSCDDPSNLVEVPGRGPYDPNRRWAYTGVGRLAIDPDLAPQSSSELSLGLELEVIPNGRASVTYIRRWMNNVIEDMSRDEGSTYFLGNPGSGIASDFPEVKRNYDAAIFQFTKAFSQQWLMQASYTLSYLRGNWEGLYRSQTGQLDPGTNTDFDLASLTVNRDGPLAGDRRHELKWYGARDIELAPSHRVTVGASYRARSGAPTNYLATHPVYGNGEVFLLPRGSGERLPWQHTIDAHLGYTLERTSTQAVSVTLDVFNLFNFLGVAGRGQTYTLRPVEPIQGVKSPFVNGDRRQVDPALIVPSDGDPRPFDETDVNRSFGVISAHQAPITFRVGLKVTF
ncbi:MAG: TonB-dependent receptor [Deltaproteobacteria bacterium]